jgi:hypothetical protein
MLAEHRYAIACATQSQDGVTSTLQRAEAKLWLPLDTLQLLRLWSTSSLLIVVVKPERELEHSHWPDFTHHNQLHELPASPSEWITEKGPTRYLRRRLSSRDKAMPLNHQLSKDKAMPSNRQSSKDKATLLMSPTPSIKSVELQPGHR